MGADARARTQPGEAVYRYRPALDGVRAFAVAGVVLFHAGVPGIPGGFLGVDAFFVLSGFLITSLLLAERERTGRVDLAAFWGRRARRLLPALLVLLIAVVVTSQFLLPTVELRLLRGDGLAALVYVANWRMIYRGGGNYFAQTSAPSPLQHTWSLGIEEQFYLFWPLIVIGTAACLATRRVARRPRTEPASGGGEQPPRGASRQARVVLLLLAVAGTGASAYAAASAFTPAGINRVYFGTDTRVQAILIGCALALLLSLLDDRAQGADPHRAHPILGTFAICAAAGLGWLLTNADGTAAWLYRDAGLTAAAFAVAVLIAHAVVSPNSPTARMLALTPLVWLGRISYGVYLWHWPLFQFVNAEHTGLSGLSLLFLRLGLVLVIPIASFFVIEEPIRHGRLLRRIPKLTPVTTTLVAVAATAVVVVVGTIPTPAQRTSFTAPRNPVYSPGSTARSHLPPPMRRSGRRPGAQPRIDFFGDSVAWTIGTYLPNQSNAAVTTRAIQGCGITLQSDIVELGSPHTLYPYCPSWPSRWQSGVDADDPDVSVILLNRWELMDARLNGKYTHVGNPDFNAYLSGQLNRAVSIAGSHGARVVLLTAAYTHRAERTDGGLYDEDQPSRVDAWNAVIRAEAAKHPDTTVVLDLNKLVCPDGRYTESVNGLRVRSDGLHFTPEGVQQLIAPWLMPQLTGIATNGEP
ncbi:acyltransferase family protein [Rugosimonospora africana]|uniref:Acyltransferase n=1 Tax=Rugosimonospora africana TaxID=556532 RepID=A0A8J3VSW9_9ACTN|nr:acyltransferase family protein [Rugosimonospora africana]GIH17051.1 acyltransferase [Rugosimonospora africana]